MEGTHAPEEYCTVVVSYVLKSDFNGLCLCELLFSLKNRGQSQRLLLDPMGQKSCTLYGSHISGAVLQSEGVVSVSHFFH